jgi:Tfp pilus assembly protein FimT
MFGIISILALISFVYGFVQHAEGQRLSEQAEQERQQAIVARDEALRQVGEAELAMKKLEQLTIELEICKASRK